jgi:DeoR/GlpR family transcriptional regulator of sugar metabolism
VGTSMRYGSAPERRGWILDQLRINGFLSVPELAAQLGVSDMTIRRDLRRMQEDGEVRVVHGGVRLPHAHLRSTEFVTRAEAQAAAKCRMAEFASSLVGEHDAVAVDSGTTAYQISRCLPTWFRGSVITPSVPVVHALLDRPQLRVVSLGGDLDASSQALVGGFAVEMARQLRVRTFFLAAAAVDGHGVYLEADTERPTKLALMDVADEIVLLADHTKFARSAPVKLCSLRRLDRLVTDRRPSAGVRRRLSAAGVRVDVVDVSAQAEA